MLLNRRQYTGPPRTAIGFPVQKANGATAETHRSAPLCWGPVSVRFSLMQMFGPGQFICGVIPGSATREQGGETAEEEAVKGVLMRRYPHADQGSPHWWPLRARRDEDMPSTCPME